MQQRDSQYFKNVFELCKEIAFHQIYVSFQVRQMESCRKDLAQDEHFDPKTAFKSMDHFKHNRVVPYQLWSFFEMKQIEATIQECQHIIQSLDKSLGEMDYESFEEMTLTSDITLKNLSKTRYDNVKIGVGSYAKLTYVKEHSSHLIALFLEKQLNFNRHFLFLRQEFCRKWGGDVYTILQKMFKKYQKTEEQGLFFNQFYQMTRKYGHIFNQVEFFGIWRRSKDKRVNITEIPGNVSIKFDQLHKLILVSNLSSKLKYALQRNIPLQKAVQKPTPSYKVNHLSQYQKWEQNEKKKQIEELSTKVNTKMTNMKYSFTNWQSLQDPLHICGYFRNKSQQWYSTVDKMSEERLAEQYRRVTSGSSLVTK